MRQLSALIQTTANSNGKLSRCWDSASCEPMLPFDSPNAFSYLRFIYRSNVWLAPFLILLLPPPKCKTPRFPYPMHWSSSVELGNGSASAYAGSQDTELSCAYFHFVLHYVITIHQPDIQTGRRTDGRHARSISATCCVACRAKRNKKYKM